MSDCSTNLQTEVKEENISPDETTPSEQISDKPASTKIDEASSVKKNRRSRFKNCAICGIIKNNVSFHRFPVAPDIREQWAVFCGLDVDNLGSSPVICGNHFTEDDFMEHQSPHGDKKLLTNSIPSINPPKRLDNEIHSAEELIYETVIVSSLSDSVVHSDDDSEIRTEFTENIALDNCDVASDDDSSNINSDDVSVTISSDNQERPRLVCKRKFPRYFMDIKQEDVISPKYAKLCLEMGRQAIFNYRRKINALQHQNKRLQDKLLSAESIICQLKSNTISMDEALSTIESKHIFTFSNKGCFI